MCFSYHVFTRNCGLHDQYGNHNKRLTIIIKSQTPQKNKTVQQYTMQYIYSKTSQSGCSCSDLQWRLTSYVGNSADFFHFTHDRKEANWHVCQFDCSPLQATIMYASLHEVTWCTVVWWVYTDHTEMAAVLCGTSHASTVSTPCQWI